MLGFPRSPFQLLVMFAAFTAKIPRFNKLVYHISPISLEKKKWKKKESKLEKRQANLGLNSDGFNLAFRFAYILV